jgi:hypothetical protein
VIGSQSRVECNCCQFHIDSRYQLLDQTFSPQNLRHISDVEKRRGRVSDLSFFPEVKRRTDVLKDRIGDCKDFRRAQIGKYSEADQAIFNHLRDLREAARQDRDDQLLICLKAVSQKISKKSYRVAFSSHEGPGGKPVFQVNDKVPEHHYAIKQISRNLSRLYKVKQANRNQIIAQLVDHLSDGFPYHILRTDVAGFFEGIDHSELLAKLKSDQLLSQTSLRLIDGILFRYSQITGKPGIGLPRGIGISAYLSELYIRDFDSNVRNSPDVVYYARYVDDIVIVYAPTPTSDPTQYLSAVKEELRKKRLIINLKKTSESPLGTSGSIESKFGWKFDYLGYEFLYAAKLKVRLSSSKQLKYLQRLEASFKRYNLQRAKNSKKAYRLLLKRARFLTGNTQLTHNKQNAFVGIYFSNPHLTDHSQLMELDANLNRLRAGVGSASLRDKLGQCSFLEGYKQKIFRRFHNKNEFENIVKAWKYGR